MTLRVGISDVAGCKPTVAHYREARFRLSVVAAHDIWTTNQHLAIFSNRHFDVRKWFADRTDTIIVRTIGANDARFRHTIALEDLNTRAQK